MKKLYFALIAILCAVTANAATLYLKPNANWLTDGARFAAYFFGNGEKWVSMTDSDSDGIYEVEAPEGYPNVIFCRMNPSTTDNNWDNKWNQTADLTVPTDNKVLYTVAANTWDNGGGAWSSIGALEAPTFSVPAGIFADSFQVSISTKYDNAIIKYSINGSDYADYSAPITISETSTVKAYAHVEGYEYAEAEVTYTKQTSDFTETTLYLTPGEWSSDNAWFAAYFYGNGDTWVKLEKFNDTMYKLEVPNGGYTSLIFTRMNPNGAIMSWDYRWNQTVDLSIPTDGTNNFTITEPWPEDGGAKGEWSVYNGGTEVVPTLTFEGGEVLYLLPSSQWKADNAWFAMYVYGENNTNAWATCSDADGDGLYEVEIPEGTWTNLIFTRMNPEFTETGWNNGDEDETGAAKRVWGQTGDLFYDGTNNEYVIQGWNYGAWTVYSESAAYVDLYVNDQIGWDTLSVYAYETGVSGDDLDLPFFGWPGMTSYKEMTFSDVVYVEDGVEVNKATYKVFRFPSSMRMYMLIFNNGISGDGQLQIDVQEAITADKYYYFRIWNEGTAEEPSFKYELVTELMTGVENIEVENVNAPVEYYNFQGVRVANPENGMFIRVQGGKATKVILK